NVTRRHIKKSRRHDDSDVESVRSNETTTSGQNISAPTLAPTTRRMASYGKEKEYLEQQGERTTVHKHSTTVDNELRKERKQKKHLQEKQGGNPGVSSLSIHYTYQAR